MDENGDRGFTATRGLAWATAGLLVIGALSVGTVKDTNGVADQGIVAAAGSGVSGVDPPTTTSTEPPTTLAAPTTVAVTSPTKAVPTTVRPTTSPSRPPRTTPTTRPGDDDHGGGAVGQVGHDHGGQRLHPRGDPETDRS